MTNLKKRVASHKILRFLQNNKVIFFFQKKSVQSDHWRLLKKKIAKIEGVASLNLKNKRDRKEIQPLILSHLAFQESVTTLSNLTSTERCFIETSAVSPPVFSGEKTGGETPFHPSHSTSSLFSGGKPSYEINEPPSRLDICQGKKNREEQAESEGRLEMVERICGLLYAPNLILGSDSLKKLAHLSHQLREDSNLIFIGGWDGDGVINHLDSLRLLETPQNIWKEGVSCLSSCYANPYFFLYSLLQKRGNSLIYSLKEKMRALTRSLQERRDLQIKGVSPPVFSGKKTGGEE